MTELAVIKGMTPGAYGIFAILAVLVLTLIKIWPKLKEMQIGADSSLRAELMARITQLETQLTRVETDQAAERESHSNQMRLMAERHAAEMQILRHRLNNETHSLDALLLLLETNPERTIESVGRIKEMRVAQAQQIALEQGAAAGKAKT